MGLFTRKHLAVSQRIILAVTGRSWGLNGDGGRVWVMTVMWRWRLLVAVETHRLLHGSTNYSQRERTTAIGSAPLLSPEIRPQSWAALWEYVCMCVCACVCIYTQTHTHTQWANIYADMVMTRCGLSLTKYYNGWSEHDLSEFDVVCLLLADVVAPASEKWLPSSDF